MTFEISTLDDAANATKQAAIAGAISGAVTLVFAVIAIANGRALLDGAITGWAVLDAAITFGLAYGVFRKSRASAVGLLAYYLLNQVVLRAEVGWGSGLGMAVFFVFFFVQGVRGAFAYHRMSADDGVHPEGEPPSGVVGETA